MIKFNYKDRAPGTVIAYACTAPIELHWQVLNLYHESNIWYKGDKERTKYCPNPKEGSLSQLLHD